MEDMKREDIIKLAKETHKIEYDYSLVKDCKKNDNVDIICLKHGIFSTRLNRFLKGSNCPYCSNKVKKTKETFVFEANEVHNDKYTYDNFEYINSHTKSFITCPIHGDFEQSPTNHLNGNGCPKCFFEKESKLYCSNTEEFIKKANKIHNNFYLYDKVEYVKNTINVIITCPIHGDFEQSPHNHLQGKGCPICKQSHLENEIKKCLVENNINFEWQKRFEWLGKQSLDFYLPDYNIGIECQGKQHFGIGGWSEHYDFDKQIERDTLKYKLCKEKNIRILYYTNTSEITNTSIYNDNIFYSFNDILNILGINKIKNDIISLLNNNNISYIDNINNIQINKVFIYPLSDISTFLNSNDKNYFNNISIDADTKNERIIWIKPFEWYDDVKRKILESFILSACGVIKNKIYARDCYIKTISNKDVKTFLNRTSMLGYRSSSLCLGLFLKKDKGIFKKDEMLMCYTFGSAFYGKGKYDIEVIRASTELNTQVIGGASKLWSYFVKNYETIKINNKNIKWNTCCYYVDFDHNNGNSLIYLGFNFNHYTEGGYNNVYKDVTKKINRMPSKHNEIKKMIENGELNIIHNAGTKVYVFDKNKKSK